MILGSVDTTDYDFENNTAISRSSNRVYDNYKSLKCKAIEEDMDIEELNSNELSINIDSSDYDTDNSFSVISEESFSNKSLRSESSDDSIEFCDATVMLSDYHIMPCASIDIEILEENNNDPNNNLDSIQSDQEQINLTSEDPDNTRRIKDMECEINSVPGCSKDSDIQNKLRAEALQIHGLLPQFTYEQIYEVLSKNYFAENRVILSLWDLLPFKRPKAKPLSIMKYNNNSIKNFNQIRKDIEQRKTEINCNRNLDEDIVILNDTDLKNYSLNIENVQNNDNVQDKTDISQLKQEIILTKDNTVYQSTQNSILHPAKLVLNNKTLSKKQVTSCNNSILTPPKLTNVTSQLHKISKNKNVLISPKKCKYNEFVDSKNTLLGKKVLQPNATNARVNNNKQTKLGTLDKYLQYLSCIEDVKKQKLYKNVKNYNFPDRNQIRQYFLHSQSRSSNKDISQYINKNNKLKTLDITNINYNTYNAAEHSKLKKINAITSVASSPHTTFNDVNTVGSNTMLDVEIVDLIEDAQSCQSSFKDVVSASTSSEIVSTSIASQKLHTLPSHDTAIQMIKTTVTDPTCQAGSNNSKNLIPSTQSSLNDDLGSDKSQFAVTTVPENSTSLSLTSTDDKRFSSAMFDKPSSSSHIFGGVKKKEYNMQNRGNQFPECQQIYKDLQSVFSHIDKDFSEDTCLKFLKMETHKVPFEILQDLAEYILENVTCDINEKVANLSSLFPEVDVTELKKLVQSVKDDTIFKYLQSRRKNPTYITKKERLQRIRITEQKQYTGNFDVKKFLEIFPDPFQYFENPNRQCEYKADAYEILKSYFKFLKVDILKVYYVHNKYNLSLTVRALEEIKPDACSGQFIDSWKINLSEDIPLLRECEFITYKVQIRDYINKIEEEKMREFEELKKNNELLECQCCYNNECMPFKCSTCDDGHIFCNSCIIKSIEIKLAQGDTHMSCLVECNEEFNLSTLQRILPPSQFSILISKKQEAEVMAAGLVGLVSCPFCPFACIPPPEDKIFKCFNPDCMKESCRLCKKLNHIPLRCYEEETDKARLVLEEKMTEALVRKCYRCAKPYFKEDGCNKICCSCGAIMCYICDKQINGYDHFNDNSCPLWSDSRTLNADAVDAVAKKTLKYLTEKDPNVQLDASTFLLHSKPSNISNAALLKRVNQITKFDI